MNIRAFSDLGNQALLRRLAEEIAHQNVSTATLLALIAEVDERLLYLPAGYPSMCAYCVHELHLSKEAALKRIHAARAAREFEGILDAVAEGRVHLSGVLMLAPHLTPENAADLLAAATHRTKAKIERLIAERFPRPDVPTRVAALTFGVGFMSEKRAEARAREEARKQAKVRAVDEGARMGATAEEAQTRAAAPVAKGATAPAPEPSTEPADERDVTPYLRKLGCNASDARRVAALCTNLPNASLEERVRFALKQLMPPHRWIAA